MTIRQLAIDTWPFGKSLTGDQAGAIGRAHPGGRTLVLATGLDTLATTVLLLSQCTVALYLLAGVLHLLAGAVVWTGSHSSTSRRVFMTALALSLPLVGASIAALALGTPGRGDIAQFFAAEPPKPRALTAADVRGLTDRLPPCEAVLSTNREERSATFAMLTRQGDAAAIRILRWAVAGQNQELAVEAALALEDLSTQFEGRAVASRRALLSEPGFDSALALAETLAEAIENGLVDLSLIPPLAAEARTCYRNAESFAPDRMAEVAVKHARLELAVLCPSEALAVLDRAGAAESHGDVGALRAQMESAARRPRAPLHLVQVAA